MIPLPVNAADEIARAYRRELTAAEERALRDLRRLARNWPATLKLFSWSGTLCVVPNDGSFADADDPSALVIDWIEGIPNDGGDP